MNYFIKNLELYNCIRVNVGKSVILLDSFKKYYDRGFGADSIVIENKNGFFSYGVYGNENSIVNDLKDNGTKVYDLSKFLEDKIYEKIIEGLFDYVEENKNKQLFNKQSIYIWRNFSKLGKNPLVSMQEKIDFSMDFEDFVNDEIILNNSGKVIKYNIIKDTFYKEDTDMLSQSDMAKLVLNTFTSDYDRNLYVLYHNYINNNLKNEDLAYKEIANLNKWFENKSMVYVVYKKENYEDLEDLTELSKDKVKADTDMLFDLLNKEYYEEMLGFYGGIDSIKTIKQIRGFEYRNEFYKLNVNNLLYKKEVK